MNNIKSLREKKRLTQMELALAIGLQSDRTIRRYEKQDARPPLMRVLSMVSILGPIVCLSLSIEPANEGSGK